MEVLSECPQHQLTCRRVKDSLAKLYNTVQSWSSLSSRSFDTLSRLLNILTEEQHLHEGGGATVGEIGGKEARIRLEGKLIDRREKLYSELRQSLDAMEANVNKIGSVLIGLRASVELLANQGNGNTPLFATLPVTTISEYVSDIYLCYCEEQHLYRCIVDDVLKQKNRDTLLVYLSCWIHEPCISEDMKLKLESLLIDSGLKND